MEEYRDMVESSVIGAHGGGGYPAANTPGEADEGMHAAEGMGGIGPDLAQTDPYEEQADAARQEERYYTRADVDTDIRRKLNLANKSMQRKWKNDPCYLRGKQAAEEEAALAARENEVSLLVREAEKHIPVNSAIARQLTENPAVRRVGLELFQAVLDGETPKDFNVRAYVNEHPGFLKDCVRFGVRSALASVRGKDEELQNNARAQMQRALPRSTRPAYNTRVSGGTDYMAMSDEQFKRAQKDIHDAYLNGKKVKL